jgi:ParB-like chromosome segregation protein Spo0J
VIAISLGLVKANPFRNFDLHPIEQGQVDRLKASIDADGFWATVVAREVEGEYQIAFGHHRIEAARQLGFDEVPLDVRELDDWQMVRMLATENATQRGSTTAACLDSVAAVSSVLAYSLLRWNKDRFSKIFENLSLSYAECRGRLEAGSGLGEPSICAVLPEGCFQTGQVRLALSMLKDSGRMMRIIADARARVDAELQAEQEQAKLELQAAKKRQANARSERAREAAAEQARQAEAEIEQNARAQKATFKAEEAVKAKPIIFDDRCAQLFEIDSHLNLFRKLMTGDKFQAYLPVEKQFEFAKHVLEQIKDTRGPKDHLLTAKRLQNECWVQLENALAQPRMVINRDPDPPYRFEMVEGLEQFRRAALGLRRAADILKRAFDKGEAFEGWQSSEFDKDADIVDSVMEAVRPYRNLYVGEGRDAA